MFRHEAQRIKRAGTRCLVLQKVRIDVNFVEKDIRNGIVPALREPAALVIAAAEMHGQVEGGRAVSECAVYDFRIQVVQQISRIISARLHHVLKLFVAQRGHGRVVHLQIAAARIVERVHFLLVSINDVSPEKVHVRISAFTYGSAPGCEMQDDGGGYGHFWCSFGDGPKKSEVIGVNRRTPSHARYNLGPWNGNLAALMVDKVGRRAFHPHFHTAKASHEEVRIEVLAAKLAIGDGLQSNPLLLGDGPAGICILDGL